MVIIAFGLVLAAGCVLGIALCLLTVGLVLHQVLSSYTDRVCRTVQDEIRRSTVCVTVTSLPGGQYQWEAVNVNSRQSLLGWARTQSEAAQHGREAAVDLIP